MLTWEKIQMSKKQLHVCNLYKTCKSTKNWSSNFGWIEETIDLSHILLDAENLIMGSMYYKNLKPTRVSGFKVTIVNR